MFYALNSPCTKWQQIEISKLSARKQYRPINTYMYDASLVIVTKALLNWTLQLIVQSFQTFKFCIDDNSKGCESQARSPSHRFTGESKQTITTNLSQLQSTQKEDAITTCHNLELFVAQCTLVEGPMHSGKKPQSILVKSDDFENSFSLSYILLKFCLCCCSLATVAPQQKD